MNDTIAIRPAALNATLDLVTTTALVDVTRMDSTEGGVMALSLRWPGISSGEKVLWQVVAWLNSQGPRPDDFTLRADLDDSNYAAVTRLLAEVA